ncbi:MAG: hypothetical protein QM541_06330 [Flavobacterium sp.]|nr:hypothetical protein [Flavobacterium sp.]
MKVFLSIFSVKLCLSTIFIFFWISFFPNLYSLFNPSSDNFDSIRYNHDAYLMAKGASSGFWALEKNAFTIKYGSIIYKLFFTHPWFVTFFNCLISSITTYLLYVKLQHFFVDKALKIVFWLSNFFPIIIAYESILGKEVFYLAGFKIMLILLVVFFHSPKRRYCKIEMFVLILAFFVFAYSRPVLFPYFAVGFFAYYLDFKWTFFLSGILGSLVFFTLKNNDILYLQRQNVENVSFYPSFQALRELLFSKSLFQNCIYGLGRFLVYLFYPFPLILPNLAFLKESNATLKCTRLLTVCEQLSFFWQLIIITFTFLHVKMSLISEKIWLHFFLISIGCEVVLSYSFPLLHARYRIFFFITYFAFIIELTRCVKVFYARHLANKIF